MGSLYPEPLNHEEYNRSVGRHRQIQDRAYFLWCEAGLPTDTALDFWLKAEQEWEEDEAFNRRRLMRWGY